MSDVWKQCEGQVIDNKFRLQQYLGGTDDSAVFLTELAGSPSREAAIKFIPAGTAADLHLSLWRRAMQLAHPNLLRIFDSGRCRLSNMDRLYIVMEHAEEDLSQILPQRPLTASEAREMLEPVLDVLVFLHGNGLVHSRIKPSNILATADQLKLSSDTFFPIGESRKSSRTLDAHDAPESAASPVSAAADVWSLGMTLVETLTQHPPALQPGSEADPIVPDTLPQPFLDIASAANPGGAGPFAISRRASIPWPSALPPPNRFLLWLFRCHPFLPSPRQSCKSLSSTHLRQGRKRNPRVRKPRTRRGKLLFSPTMSFLLPLRFSLSSRSSRCRKSLAIVPTPLRPLQRPLPRLRRSQNRSSSLRVVKPRQHQSRPHQLQRKTRSRPPLRKILWHSHSVRRLPHPPVLLCARIPFRPQTRQALPRHLPRAVKSSNRFCPRSPRRLAPPFKASCASASACTSTPQAMLLKPRSILVAPVSILPTLL